MNHKTFFGRTLHEANMKIMDELKGMSFQRVAIREVTRFAGLIGRSGYEVTVAIDDDDDSRDDIRQTAQDGRESAYTAGK